MNGVGQELKTLSSGVSQFDVSGRTLLIPEMNPIASRFLAACFRAFGVDAVVMETYKGLSLGKELTSGKECFPCQVTLGDIIYYLREEKRRLGNTFSAERYVYFLPESDGPCRFGMYNKYQRLVLDRFPEFRNVPITYLSSLDGYAVSILPPERAAYFRRVAYVATVIADVLDRITWRVRPYEYREGSTDDLVGKSVAEVESALEEQGSKRDFQRLCAIVEDCAANARNLLDPRKVRRPRIGVVGEIYIRSHPQCNQDVARQIERFGGEVVIASVAEWINYVTYDCVRRIKKRIQAESRARNWVRVRELLRRLASSMIDKWYQTWRWRQVYRSALKYLDIEADHSISSIEKWLDNNRHFSFDVGTEAALSIGGALAYVHEGFNGIINVFPFTCMPSTICSAILKPLLTRLRVPYLDVSYDGSIQPNREIALRTFLYQAKQHLAQKTAGK